MTTAPRSTRRRRTTRAAALTVAAALALPLASLTGANAAPAIAITSTVSVGGVYPSGAEYAPVSAEAPDGTVYVATLAAGAQAVWAAPLTGPPTKLLTSTGIGATIALAADASHVFVGSTTAINSYSRTTGALEQHWALSPKPRALSQLVVAGNRVWALLTPVGYKRAPSSLLELNPASPTRVRTINGVYDTFSLAPTATGIFFVTNKDSTLEGILNTGPIETAKTHLVVSQLLAGPAAVQALLVRGPLVVLRYDFGQGTDAQILTFDTSTFQQVGKGSLFNAGDLLGSTSLGLLAVEYAPNTGQCTKGTKGLCLQRFALGGAGGHGASLAIPYATDGDLLGPHAAMVGVTSSGAQRILRFG